MTVITGGGSGIGKEIIRALPGDNPVIITGRTAEKLNKTAGELNAEGCNVITVTCDVSDRESVRKLAVYASSLGNVKRVINCAGVSGTMGDRETIIRINALGTVYINQEFYKVMSRGVICDISSNSGYILPKILLPSNKTYRLVLTDEESFVKKMKRKAKLFRNEAVNSQIAYIISKNFVKWYSQNCAFKYMDTKNIRVFSVSPGFVNTPMTDAEKGDATDVLLGYSGLKRGAEPKELAYLIVALCDERCGYLTGADILCDGGCINNGYGFLNSSRKYDGHASEENW